MRSLTLAALLCSIAASAEKPRLVVLDLVPGGGAEPQVVAAFTEALTNLISKAGYFDVASSRDVAALLGVERQKELLGCSEGAGTCMAEVSGALGARFIMSGSLVKLGDVWQLTLTTLDSQKSQPIGRATRIASDLAALQAQLPWSVAEATATPAPEPTSKVLPVTILAVGGAAIVVGAVLGLQALSTEATVQGELSAAQLDRLDHYQQQQASVGTLKTASLITLITGAAVVGLGVVLYARSPGGAKVALMPMGNGAALAGTFP